MLTLCDSHHAPITFYKPIGGGCPLCAALTADPVEIEDLKEKLSDSESAFHESEQTENTLRERLSSAESSLSECQRRLDNAVTMLKLNRLEAPL